MCGSFNHESVNHWWRRPRTCPSLKAAQSAQVDTVYVAPGNAGTALEPNVENLAISATDIPALLDFAKTNKIELTIVGPEAPLVIGVVDAFNAAGLAIFGPTKAAAQLEGSKAFTKDFLARHNIPTAGYKNCTEISDAKAFVRELTATTGYPVVIKADGLAAGKGVIIAQDQAEADAAIDDMLAGNKFGEAGSRVVIEEFLKGEEASFIVMVDGKTFCQWPPAKIIKPVITAITAQILAAWALTRQHLW